MQITRHLLRTVGAAAVASVMCAPAARAQAPQGGAPQGGAPQAAAPPMLMVSQLKPDVYLVTGGGGNVTVIVGKTSVILVDSKISEAAGKALLAEIAKITPKPVTTVFLTHSDPDHAGGLVAFPTGVKVIAHEGNKKEQEELIAAGGRGAPSRDRLPSQVTTKTKETMTIDGVKLELYHWAPAHTKGDLVVYLPQQKIVATGDIIQANRSDNSPLMHYPEKMGSSEGWITSVKNIIAFNADVYVPGHGDTQTKADLERRLKATTERRDLIASLVKQGKSLDEIKAASPELTPTGAPVPAGRAGGPPAGTFVDLVYAELTAKK
jgi:glyoxylase-like metal-dependent hydrolase (beta-lactamase superfamily II)